MCTNNLDDCRNLRQSVLTVLTIGAKLITINPTKGEKITFERKSQHFYVDYDVNDTPVVHAIKAHTRR